MICLKCGNEIKDNEQICGKCGWNKNNIQNNDNQFATNNIGVLNTNPVDKEEVDRRLANQKQFDELVEIYIGDKYYNFKKGSFSWCAFFLGPIYFAYRKLYGIAVVLFILSVIISSIFTRNISSLTMLKSSTIISIVVTLVIKIFEGKIFKNFYFEESIERVAQIRRKNPDLGFNQLTELVRRKGGTNILAAILPFLLIIILIILSASLIFLPKIFGLV